MPSEEPRQKGRMMDAVERAKSDGIHLSFKSLWQVTTFALTFGLALAMGIGAPVLYACYEMRRATELIQAHVDEASDQFDAVQDEIRSAREDRRQMDRRIYVLESRSGG